MNDISYTMSDAAVLRQIGDFIKQRRIQQNITQQTLASNAAISRSTLSLAERGENISLANLVKILRLLDAFYVLEKFKTEPQISPIQLAKEEQKKRKRTSKVKLQSENGDLGW